MEPKRKAAADIFQEQYNVPQSREQLVEEGLQVVMAAAPAAPAYQAQRVVMGSPSKPLPADELKSSEELQLEKEPMQVRETGMWFWKRVVVPPNAYVVHTRIGRKEPVTLGLGVSFRYNSYTDAYLTVPAAMQTIGVVANCISKEKQGINVLAYVQWQINNFAVAYRKLDFSDSRDPMGIVNAQLREQAEAAIKDKIATMGVEEVLTDKAPIIEELTARLKAVTEGRGQEVEVANEGLGIKIVTVQIREALVSSQRLWEDLQAPFRHQQEKMARISLLGVHDEIRQKELESRQTSETSEAETMVEIERIKQTKQTEALNLKLTEEAARFMREQENVRAKVQLEEATTLARQESEQRLQAQAARIEQERQLATLQQENEKLLEQARLKNEAANRQKTLQTETALHVLAEENRLAEQQLQVEQQRLARAETIKKQEAALNLLLQEQADVLQTQILAARVSREQQEHAAKLTQEEESSRLKISLHEREIELTRLEQDVRNLIGNPDLLSRLIDRLPELAAEMPEIRELRVLQTGNGNAAFDTLAHFVAQMLALAENLGIPLKGSNAAPLQKEQ